LLFEVNGNLRGWGKSNVECGVKYRSQESKGRRQQAIGNGNAGCGMEVRKEIGVRSKVKGRRANNRSP
jgi:hypothetical protein